MENSDEKKIGEKENWSKDEALALIDSYKSRQDEFQSAKRRTHVWENISEDLLCVDVRRSAKSCQVKWKNMVRTYKAVRGNFNRTGRGTSKFLFFNEMDDLMGDKLPCAVEEIEILEPEYYFESDAGFVDSRIPSNTEEVTQKRKRGTSRGEFSKLKKALCTKNEYFQRKIQIAEEESKKKEEREERKLLLIQRQLDIEERKVKVLEAYLAAKK